MSEPLVYILLSTFNGEQYLPELLESLRQQTYRNLVISVRDDGSRDRTREILREFGRARDNFELVEGGNLGPAGSFLELIRTVPPNADYFGFCDQDDYWYPDKVEAAVERLAPLGSERAMYFCRHHISDRHLRIRRLSRLPPKPLSLANALTQNVSPGCSILVNRAGTDMLQQNLPPAASIRMHDWWVYQVISATGTVVFDRQPRFAYRQHGGNLVGSPSLTGRWKRRLTGTPFRRGHIKHHAALLRRICGPALSKETRQLIDRVVEEVEHPRFLVRTRFVAKMPVYRQGALDNLALRCLVLLRMA